MQFKLVGHRGVGANGPFPFKPIQILENTVTSFNDAVKNGAHMIEFDVQLTKDLQPVVFHDFFVCNKKEHYLVSALTYSELSALVLDGYEPKSALKELSFHGPDCEKCNKTRKDYQLVYDEIPLLGDVFEKTLPVGFNIEIKYPTLDEIEDQSLSTPVIVENYCRIIVNAIKPGREIIISSFHPDICLWIRKNTEYTVFFLTDAGVTASRFDPRLSSLHAAYDFARLNHLHGIVANAAGLLKADPALISDILKTLGLFTYGRENSMINHVKSQLALGVQGIITDDLLAIAPLLSS